MTLQSDVLLPLYIYPTPTAWEPVLKTIISHPEVSFIIVVNPFNGPGNDAIPDSNYTREIARLTAYENVQLLGYVHVTYTRRNLAEVLRDITTYSNWASLSDVPGLKVDGVFVDESPNAYDLAAEIYLKTIHAKVKGSSGLGPANVIVHNPGSVADPAFLALADVTVIFEDTLDVFHTRQAAKLFDGIGERPQLACIIHSLPVDTCAEELQTVVSRCSQFAGRIFVTPHGHYADLGPHWAEFVEAVAAAHSTKQ